VATFKVNVGICCDDVAIVSEGLVAEFVNITQSKSISEPHDEPEMLNGAPEQTTVGLTVIVGKVLVPSVILITSLYGKPFVVRSKTPVELKINVALLELVVKEEVVLFTLFSKTAAPGNVHVPAALLEILISELTHPFAFS
jgi:hypothetical protein